MVGSSFQVMRKFVGFMKLYSIPFGSGGTEWSVPVTPASHAYGVDKTVLLMSCVLTVRNCLYHCTVVEAIGDLPKC